MQEGGGIRLHTNIRQINLLLKVKYLHRAAFYLFVFSFTLVLYRNTPFI